MTIVLAALLAAATIVQVVRTAILDEKAEELDKREVYLDERANRLAAWEEDLKKRDGYYYWTEGNEQ